MRKKLINVLGFLSLLVLILLVSFEIFTRETEDWDFIQKVGGIKTGTPLDTENGFNLPVKCNISGLDPVTIKPTTLNSALSCLKIKSTVNGNTIHVRVTAGLAVAKKSDCNGCDRDHLHGILPGKVCPIPGREDFVKDLKQRFYEKMSSKYERFGIISGNSLFLLHQNIIRMSNRLKLSDVLNKSLMFAVWGFCRDSR